MVDDLLIPDRNKASRLRPGKFYSFLYFCPFCCPAALDQRHFDSEVLPFFTPLNQQLDVCLALTIVSACHIGRRLRARALTHTRSRPPVSGTGIRARLEASHSTYTGSATSSALLRRPQAQPGRAAVTTLQTPSTATGVVTLLWSRSSPGATARVPLRAPTMSSM